MKLTTLVPSPLKSLLGQMQHSLKKATCRSRSRDELHQYWAQPYDGDNLPEDYLREEAAARSEFLVKTIERYADPSVMILEVGCNAGRNLNFLFNAGYKNLEAIEISERAIEFLRQTFPGMANHVMIYNTSVEETIKRLADSKYGIVFTMAVLEHIHTDSEWVFLELVRITKDYLITIEDERGVSWRHFPRNYKRVFESLGMKQIDEIRDMEKYGLSSGFVTRVFKARAET